MTDELGKRPGGLTALAVLNFVFGALEVFGAFGLGFLLAVRNDWVPIKNPEARSKMLQPVAGVDDVVLQVLVALVAVKAVLLLLSGFGYLQQKRVLGRVLGSVYAVFAIAHVVGVPLWVGERGGERFAFSLASIVWLLHPLLTLVLVNGTFKEDFVR